MKLNWKATAFLIFILLLWELTSSSGIINQALFPGPIKVFGAFNAWATTSLISDFLTSSWRLILGLTMGISFGVFFGLLMGRIIFLEETISPLLHILRAFPPVALIPLIIIWFGIGDSAKIFSIAFASFFPAWLSTLIGTKTINKDYLKAAKIFKKKTIETYQKIIIPAITPFIVSGARISIGMGFIMVFVSELAGASSGIGYTIAYSQIIYRTDLMIAGLIVLGLFAFIADSLLVLFSKKIIHWGNQNG